MNRLIVLAAVGCMAAATDDHAFLERGLSQERWAETRSQGDDGKLVKTRLRVTGARGEGCETRLETDKGSLSIDWRKVNHLKLTPIVRDGWLFLGGGIEADRLIIRFKGVEDGTPVLLAMQRLQAACRPAS